MRASILRFWIIIFTSALPIIYEFPSSRRTSSSLVIYLNYFLLHFEFFFVDCSVASKLIASAASTSSNGCTPLWPCDPYDGPPSLCRPGHFTGTGKLPLSATLPYACRLAMIRPTPSPPPLRTGAHEPASCRRATTATPTGEPPAPCRHCVSALVSRPLHDPIPCYRSYVRW
jgi:hypothetical protein